MTPRAIAAAVSVSALVAFAFYFDHVRDKASKYDAARESLAHERQLFQDYKAGIEADRAARDAAEGSYIEELTLLRADINTRPVPVVRVCQPPVDRVVPAGESVTAVAGGGAAAAGPLPAGAVEDSGRSRDIGPALFRLADDADELSARTRAALAYLGE
jgi:hypothetical protein